MTDFFDDDSGFWDQRSEPTIRIDRVKGRAPERTRTHHVVQRDATPKGVPARREALDESREHDLIWVEPTADGWGGRRRSLGILGAVDPRLLSVGAIGLAAVLAVPLFGALGDKKPVDSFRVIASAESTPTTTLADPATTVVVVPTTAAVEAAPAPTQAADAGESSTASNSGSDASSGSGESSGGGSVASASASADTVLAAPSVRSAAQCGNPYEVQAGDFWLKLADGVDMSLQQFLDYNEATRDTPLYPGDTVCLPLGTSLAPATTEAPSTDAPTTEAPTTASPDTEAPTTAAPQATDAPTTEEPTTEAPTTQAPAESTAATTQPTRTTLALPTSPVPSGGEVEAMIREIWPDDLEDQAVRIAWRESNFKPNVTSGSGCCHGVFQIHEQHLRWLANYGISTVDQLFDARTNIEAAYLLYQRSGGWGPWQ